MHVCSTGLSYLALAKTHVDHAIVLMELHGTCNRQCKHVKPCINLAWPNIDLPNCCLKKLTTGFPCKMSPRNLNELLLPGSEDFKIHKSN